jgi:iodotyrosine deiodinase
MEKFRDYSEFIKLSETEMLSKSQEFLTYISNRKTVRDFSNEIVPIQIIKNCIKSAGTAPSGANLQPWHFVSINDFDTKKEIREKAEIEEQEFYNHRAPEEWLEAVKPFGTDAQKPFLENAPWLISIFVQKYSIENTGDKLKHYYAMESVGIATGILINALHYSGLATLTHTPSPMNFLNKILNRPTNEKPFLLLVVGYPKENAKVPEITKKPFNEIATFI